MTKQYPQTVSRSLDPQGLGLTTVVGQHDRRITDADINLIQDLQDFKRGEILDHTAPSGCLTLSPFRFNTLVEQSFRIPEFKVLFRGEVLTIRGNNSPDLSENKVTVGRPVFWAPGNLHDDAKIYIVFLELWFKALMTNDNSGYHVDELGNRFYYPWGCVDADIDFLKLFPEDVIDPFQGIVTTQRLQLQWRIRSQAIPLSYDFEKLRYGLDPDTSRGIQLMGRAAADEDTDHPFVPLADLTGEPCLWRAGDGNGFNSLLTVDGYTYAMPLAVVFQHNTGFYHPSTNPFGCASTKAPSARQGCLGSVSGRLDGRYADVIYTENVVDTRLSVSLTGYEVERLADVGLTDLFMGNITSKIARGEAPGNKPTAVGSKLTYTVAMSNQPATNVDTVGSFDGFANGFSSDSRIYYTTKTFTLGDRTVVGTDPTTGAPNATRWGKGDVVLARLDTNVMQGAQIVYVFVQGLSNQSGAKLPIALYGGQLQIDGLGTRQARISIISDINQSALNLGNNPLVVTVGVRYPAGGGADTRKVPAEIVGGELFDATSGVTFPVFGVSEYSVDFVRTPNTNQIKSIQVYSPTYSGSMFGVRVHKVVANTLATVTTGNEQARLNTFTMRRRNLDGSLQGLYVVAAYDVTGKSLPISRREVYGDDLIVVVNGTLDAGSVTEFVILCHQTAQAALNPPVKGVTTLEETVLVGTARADDIIPDPHCRISSVSYDGTDTTIHAYVIGGRIKGIAGNDILPLIWIRDSTGKYRAELCTTELFGSFLSIKVAKTNLEDGDWFAVLSILPTPPASSKLLMSVLYIPYQGEGLSGRDYAVLYSPAEALITTNGTGTAPIVGLSDVFPFNRQLPVATTMPSLSHWLDTDLKSQALTGDVASNFIAKRFGNVEHTFGVRLYTNDFIEPFHGTKRRKIRLLTKANNRGWSKALPHVGFAVAKLKPRSVLGDNLQSTVASVVLYVNNVTGNDTNDGLSKTTPKKTIHSAMLGLPPVIRHPVSIILVDTGVSYTIKDLAKVDFTQALMGDGETRQLRYYCLGHLAFTMQESARITIGRETTTGMRIVIDATGSEAGFGDGPTYAFLVSDSRVIFHGIQFKGFTSGAVKAIDSDVEFLDCDMSENLLGVSAEQGSLITFNKGQIALGDRGTGIIASASTVRASNVALRALTATVNAFFVASRSSSLNLSDHNAFTNPTMEIGVTLGTLVALLQTNSTIVCDPTWSSRGRARIRMNSTIVRSLAVTPFASVEKDATSDEVGELED